MICYIVSVTWPDGTVETDRACGNTPRAAAAAAESLALSYQRDGATATYRRA
jgi:hypothetical protein